MNTDFLDGVSYGFCVGLCFLAGRLVILLIIRPLSRVFQKPQ
jgi:hypothetical protein